MAVATPAAGSTRETVRQKRERDQELLVWPDLVFVEFICAVLFTVTFVILSTVFNAPLLNKANQGLTPDPSKAPWYFMNLQELLLHMDKGLAGVIVPTMLLVALMAIPYIDRGNEGQGGWFATPNAIRITAFSFVWTGVWITWLILWDNQSHVKVYHNFPRLWGNDTWVWKWPGDKAPFPHAIEGVMQPIWQLIFLKDRLALDDPSQFKFALPVPTALQLGGSNHDGRLNWPQDLEQVPLPLNGTWLWHWGRPGWMPGWMAHVYWYNSDFNIPKITAEWVMPIMAMIGLPALMILILVKIGWAHSVRDAMIALFTGFILTYVALTIVGAAFRGKSENLVPPNHVPNLDKDPHIQRQVQPPDYGYVWSYSGSGSVRDG
jgi:quinol---cytochrome c reductase cytochrome c subunit, bacillus type